MLIRQHVNNTTEVSKQRFKQQSSMHLTANGYKNPSHPPDLVELLPIYSRNNLPSEQISKIMR